eukprot:4381052-Pleurochrysis_carterae.AAC.1
MQSTFAAHRRLNRHQHGLGVAATRVRSRRAQAPLTVCPRPHPALARLRAAPPAPLCACPPRCARQLRAATHAVKVEDLPARSPCLQCLWLCAAARPTSAKPPAPGSLT